MSDTDNTSSKTYRAVDDAAAWIGGHRIPETRQIDLTDREARYELLAGTIVPVDGPADEAPATRQAVRRHRADQEG